MKAACFSVAALDFFPQQNNYYAGGNSLNQAIRYCQMGYPSAFVGAVGTDEAGDRILTLLQAESVDVSHAHRLDGSTASNQIINDELGERHGIEGAWDGGVYEQYLPDNHDWDFIKTFDIWSTHANNPCYEITLRQKSKNQLMSVDFLHLKDYTLLERSSGIADIIFFGGTVDMVEDLAHIAKNCESIIVLTLGSEGSIAFNGRHIYKQKALPLDKVVDTTGCGDAFQAAFTANYYHTKDVQSALFAGAQIAKKAAAHFGGIPWHN